LTSYEQTTKQTKLNSIIISLYNFGDVRNKHYYKLLTVADNLAKKLSEDKEYQKLMLKK